MRIKVWCDSGANIYSSREAEIDVADWGYTDEEWNNLTGDEKYDTVMQWAWDRLDIGFKEIEE
jgi:hypothetical protein